MAGPSLFSADSTRRLRGAGQSLSGAAHYIDNFVSSCSLSLSLSLSPGRRLRGAHLETLAARESLRLNEASGRGIVFQLFPRDHQETWPVKSERV